MNVTTVRFNERDAREGKNERNVVGGGTDECEGRGRAGSMNGPKYLRTSALIFLKAASFSASVFAPIINLKNPCVSAAFMKDLLFAAVECIIYLEHCIYFWYKQFVALP